MAATTSINVVRSQNLHGVEAVQSESGARNLKVKDTNEHIWA
jgi:hypothetical protein